MKTGKDKRRPDARVIETGGELFGDNSGMELVRPGSGTLPQLLFFQDGRDPIIGPQIRRRGKIFVPRKVHPTLWPALTLPMGLVDRGPAAELFAQTREVVEKFVGLPTTEAAMITTWNATSHFADVLLQPPALLIVGGDMNLAMTLLQVLHMLARHALIVADLDRHALRSLTVLRPTLLLNHPGMAEHVRALCFTSNYAGAVLPGPGGSVHDVVTSKALYLGTEPPGLYDVGIPLSLESARAVRRPLDAAACRKLRNHFQPWYLAYRLGSLRRVRQSRGTVSDPPATSQLAGMLQSCTENDKELAAQWAPLLRSSEDNVRARQLWDPRCALVEIALAQLHRRVPEISVTDLANQINVFLQSRGEIREYSPEKIGRLLDGLGFVTEPRNFGMVLVLDRDASIRIHELASKFKVGGKAAGCPDCAPQSPESE